MSGSNKPIWPETGQGLHDLHRRVEKDVCVLTDQLFELSTVLAQQGFSSLRQGPFFLDADIPVALADSLTLFDPKNESRWPIVFAKLVFRLGIAPLLMRPMMHTPAFGLPEWKRQMYLCPYILASQRTVESMDVANLELFNLLRQIERQPIMTTFSPAEAAACYFRKDKGRTLQIACRQLELHNRFLTCGYAAMKLWFICQSPDCLTDSPRAAESAWFGTIEKLWRLDEFLRHYVVEKFSDDPPNTLNTFYRNAVREAAELSVARQIDVWLVETWPCFEYFQWRYPDVRRLAAKKFEYPDLPILVGASAASFEKHCKRLGLRLGIAAQKQKGRPSQAAEDDYLDEGSFPPGWEHILKLESIYMRWKNRSQVPTKADALQQRELALIEAYRPAVAAGFTLPTTMQAKTGTKTV